MQVPRRGGRDGCLYKINLRPRTRWLVIAVGLLTIPSLLNSEEFTFRVYRHPSMKFTQQQADKILDQSTKLFGSANCDVLLSRVGAIRIYSDQDGIVDSKTAFYALQPPPPGPRIRDIAELVYIHVKVVRQISWCGGKPVPATTAWGCTEPKQNWMVVRQPERNSPDTVVWTHEFIHSRGMSGHTPNSQGTNFVMTETVTDKCIRMLADYCKTVLDAPLGNELVPFKPN